MADQPTNYYLSALKNGAQILSRKIQQKVFDAINAARITRVIIPLTDGKKVLPSIEADIKRTPLGGTTITFPPMLNPATGSGSGSASIQQFKIVSDGGDYWNCKTWDGTTLGSSVVKVAKPLKIRCDAGAIASETIYRGGSGIVQSYTYAPQTVSGVVAYYIRTVTVGGNVIENDVVEPDPLANDIIYAVNGFVTATPSSLVGVTYLDINADGRAWAEV
jgi:hypothetical protein